MPSCECCYAEASRRSWGGEDTLSLYKEILAEHKEAGCVCLEDSEEGRIARAGQFWVDGRDTRETANEEA